MLVDSPAHTQASAASRSAEAEIKSVLDDFHDAASKADEDRYFAHFDRDSVFLGTDAKERWDKEAFEVYAHPHFAKGKAWSFQPAHRTITIDPSGTFAWFDETLVTDRLGPARGSGVLAKRQGKWVILQYDLALTVPNEHFDVVKEAAGDARVLGSEETDAVAMLGWVGGTWVADTPNGRIEESWLPAEGRSMIAARRVTRGATTDRFEVLRIVPRAKVFDLMVQPPGAAPVTFSGVSASDSSAVFENEADSWPKRISYKRDASRIFVRLEGATDKDPVDEYTLQKAVIRR